tara:strand:- start:53 stop:670 length:618 start_codon:yes stop_codon:yes gene_type:complete
MSFITRTSKIVMTDKQCLEEAVLALGGKINQSQNHAKLTLIAANVDVSLHKKGGGFWSYSYDDRSGYRYSDFNKWFQEVEKKYGELLEAKKKRLEEEKIRVRLAKERLEKLNQMNTESIEETIESQSESRKRIQKAEDSLLNAEKLLDDASSDLERIRKSREEYVRKTSEMVIEETSKDGWKLARESHNASKQFTRIQLRRKRLN